MGKSKFTDEQKAQAVADADKVDNAVKKGARIAKVAQRHGINERTLRKWITAQRIQIGGGNPYGYLDQFENDSVFFSRNDFLVEFTRFIGVEYNLREPYMGVAIVIAECNRLLSDTKLSKGDKIKWWQDINKYFYPKVAIAPDGAELTRKNCSSSCVNAQILLSSLESILKIVEAPEPMISDLNLLLKKHLPYRADKRAEVQEFIFDNPELSIAEVAVQMNYNKGQLEKDVENGLIFGAW